MTMSVFNEIRMEFLLFTIFLKRLMSYGPAKWLFRYFYALKWNRRPLAISLDSFIRYYYVAWNCKQHSQLTVRKFESLM